jgi:outer membrane immunogenic protein
MKKLITTALLCIAPLAANAADLPRKAPAPVAVAAPTWTGMYLGFTVGGLSGDAKYATGINNLGPVRGFEHAINGVFVGLRGGYDWQVGPNAVFGVLGEINYGKISGNVSFDGPPGTFRTEMPWHAQLGARAGLLVQPATLVYVHGGAAYADVDWASGNAVLSGGNAPGPWTSGKGSHGYWGWIVGGGVEHKFSQRLSIFLEGSYADYGSKTYTFFEVDDGQNRSVKLDLNVMKATTGFNFRW